MSAVDDLLTTSATARELKCSEAYVRKLANSGRLAVQRTTNGTRVFRREDIDAYRAASRTPSPEAA